MAERHLLADSITISRILGELTYGITVPDAINVDDWAQALDTDVTTRLSEGTCTHTQTSGQAIGCAIRVTHVELSDAYNRATRDVTPSLTELAQRYAAELPVRIPGAELGEVPA
jgi:hypothetical protein